MYRTVYWEDGNVVMLDQRLLPGTEVYNTYKSHDEVAQAITDLVVRGAPAIGVSAGMGIALGLKNLPTDQDLAEGFAAICERMSIARPTAVNLFWAIDRMKRRFADLSGQSREQIIADLITESQLMHDEDIESCKSIGRFGGPLLPDEGVVLTHCNAGALATAGYGTALGVIRGAVEQGKDVHVYSDETRPFNQGARLTTWELQKDNIPVTHICDNMAGYYMQQGVIKSVVVGSDRIAANGDVANKIGTYSVAVLAKEHNIPFYVAAPLSTVDFNCPEGAQIPIEERAGDESAFVGETRLTPEGVPSAYPAFDVTPNHLVTAIITDKGVAKAPFLESLAAQRD
jgi:methylthioribose-1-phosphate isomerase